MQPEKTKSSPRVRRVARSTLSGRRILGIDEVGRGPWAGPLVVGAVILPEIATSEADDFENADSEADDWLDQLADSKKLTKLRREKLAPKIQAAAATGLGWVSACELDEIGLAEALKLATRRAVRAVREKNAPFTEIIIDGTSNFLAGTTLENYVTVLKKADALIKEVSAASILAKVARDEYMQNLAEIYPDFGFENHVGYGTAAHKLALEKFGPTPEHRQSFRPVAQISENFDVPDRTDRDFFAAERAGKPLALKNTTELGQTAEAKVADFLESEGHTLVAKNHKTKFYEIDLITETADHIYFTEVKYRRTNHQGSPFESITADKQRQMRFAAEAFLKYSGTKKSPLLAVAAVSGPDFHLDDWFTLDA